MAEKRKGRKPTVSNDSQQLANGDFWYYESPGHIEIIVTRSAFEKHLNSAGGTFVRISRRKLNASLKRMNAVARARGRKAK
jgi:hypothetical protein